MDDHEPEDIDMNIRTGTNEFDGLVLLFREERKTGKKVVVSEKKSNAKNLFPLPDSEEDEYATTRYVVMTVDPAVEWYDPITGDLIPNPNTDFLSAVEKGSDIPDDVYEGVKSNFTDGEDF